MSKRTRKMMADRVPSKEDFTSHPQNLDELHGWKNFGGLSLDQAKARFAESPLFYQEDFMFMGTAAFLFYFPVLDDHLRSAPAEEDDVDHEAWIIAQGIRAQFDADNCDRLRPLVPRVVALADFVRDNVVRFGWDDVERRRVAKAWSELVDHIHRHNDA